MKELELNLQFGNFFAVRLEGLEMSWNPQIDVHYFNTSYPYNSAGSFIEYFEGLTYQHVDFIFDGSSHVQESVYPSAATGLYKFGPFDSGSFSYYGQSYELNDCESRSYEQRRTLENSALNSEQTTANLETGRSARTTTRGNSMDCPRRNNSAHDYQVIQQDSVDPDNMTYEELLELGETAGSRNRGLSQELISLLPISKYKCSIFSRKRSRTERCVICQMEYKRGNKRISLPCKHTYHASCGTRWLSINKACPICYTEVFGDAARR